MLLICVSSQRAASSPFMKYGLTTAEKKATLNHASTAALGARVATRHWSIELSDTACRVT